MRDYIVGCLICKVHTTKNELRGDIIMKHRIAVIDTGIDLSNMQIKKSMQSVQGVRFRRMKDSSLDITTTTEDQNCIIDDIGHGTAICGIILGHNPEVELYTVKMFDKDNLFSDENMLTTVLEYIYYNVDCDIVNLSLGLCLLDDYNKLYTICERFTRDNRIIISAFDNNGSISYPAEFDNVIGVTSEEICYRNDEYYCVDSSVVDICAKGRIQRVLGLDNNYTLGSGNSFACAHFTGILASQDIIFSHLTRNEIIERIRIYSTGNITLPVPTKQVKCLNNPVSMYKRAVIFPFNKEMHSIVRFSDMLAFELVDVYETKYSGLISAHTDTLLKEKCSKNFAIRNINDIDWNSFDTFILGHIDEYTSVLGQTGFKEELVKEIIQQEKYLYTFDDVSDCCPLSVVDSKRIYHPAINIDDVPIAPFGKLYRHNKPVLGVFGTSSQLGKFTLQLRIRAEFLRRGYKIMQIGTEPSALLFDMDVVFPVGYNSSVSIHGYDTISYLNAKMHVLSENADLIIVGSQSGVIPPDDGNLMNYNFVQLELLYATQPDAIVLCINASDDLLMVKKSKQFIESASNAKVIALCLFPLYYPNSEKGFMHLSPAPIVVYNAIYELYMNEFNIPTYHLGNPLHIEQLCNDIVYTFSEPE
ncbi:MAG: S8 family serine peptidase [Epulopiscium sp.]|nr:S8 family serine peptidase [Candidatus Epulonipiscium sp.]